jgi:hypothetical protein
MIDPATPSYSSAMIGLEAKIRGAAASTSGMSHRSSFHNDRHPELKVGCAETTRASTI